MDSITKQSYLFPAGGALLSVASGRRSERATADARDAADECMVYVLELRATWR